MSEQQTTDQLLQERVAVYGDYVFNMESVAKIWSGLLGVEIHDWQVPLLMSAYKMFRTFQQPDYSDNSDDIDGWKAGFVKVMNANHGGIVQARTVEEYRAKKEALEESAMTIDAGAAMFESARVFMTMDPPRQSWEELLDGKRPGEVDVTQKNSDAGEDRRPQGNAERRISFTLFQTGPGRKVMLDSGTGVRPATQAEIDMWEVWTGEQFD